MKQTFFSKLKKENKLKLVEPSNEVSLSYLKKSENSLRAAKILLKNNLYDDSLSSSYYAIYNSLTALLFKIGIKCENHSASIILLRKLFKKEELFKIISNAKKERIDKQYYVDTEEILNENSTKEMIKRAENFILEIKLIINNLKKQEIINYREKFLTLIS